MDEDALLDAAIAQNNSCPHAKCSASTNVTGAVCVQCHKKFCFKHLLPEVNIITSISTVSNLKGIKKN